MSTKENRKNELAALDKLINEITVEAYGDNEQLWAFRQVFEDDVNLPADGFVIGEPVSVVDIEYDGNERRGLTAKCRREDGSEHSVAASDVVFPKGSSALLLLAAYRRWLGLDSYPAVTQKHARRRRQHKATDDNLGELSLSDDFNGVLHWGLIDNRPFLRCIHGYGLCLWRLGHFDDAERVFDRMLWLNPSDNQGVRFLIDDVRAGTAWEEREDK